MAESRGNLDFQGSRLSFFCIVACLDPLFSFFMVCRIAPAGMLPIRRFFCPAYRIMPRMEEAIHPVCHLPRLSLK